MISISVGFVATPATELMPSLVVAGLTNGRAEVGTNLSASLSDGTAITSFAWGSSPGGTEYGTAGILTVPPAATGGSIYLTAQAPAGLFSVVLTVPSGAPETSVFIADFDGIDVESLAPLPSLPALTPVPNTNTITLEIF